METNKSSISHVGLYSKLVALSRSLRSGVRLEHLLGGIAGGTLSTLVLHPFDLIKIRFAGNQCLITRH